MASAFALAVWVIYVGLTTAASFDDAFITYRYARNLSQGLGFVFNVGEQVLGTTTPLYTLVLAALALTGWSIPSISIVIGTLAWAACVGLVFVLGQEFGSDLGGLAAAAVVAFDPLLRTTLGMETTLYLGLILSSFLAYRREHRDLAAGLAALTFLTRWDGILVLGCLGLAEMIRTRRIPWRFAGVWLSLAGPWLIFSQIYFGSIFPNTFFAKAGQAQGGLVGGGADPFLQVLGRLVAERFAAQPFLAVYVFLGAIGLGFNRKGMTLNWPLWLWQVLYILGYAAIGVIGFHWYFAPLIPIVALLTAQGVAALLSRMAPTLSLRRQLLAPVLLAFVVWPQVALFVSAPPPNSIRVETYRQVSDWIRAHTGSNDRVALLEIGAVGYLSDRPIIDMMGLVSPAMNGHLRDWQGVFYFAIMRHWPEVVVVMQNMPWSDPGVGNPLGDIYRRVALIENPADPGAPMAIYQRRVDFPPVEYARSWPVELTYAGQFSLDDVSVGVSALEPDSLVPLRLTWRVLASGPVDYRFELEWINISTGERTWLFEDYRPLLNSAPTSSWRSGERFEDVRMVRVPTELPAGPYRIVLRVFDDQREIVPQRHDDTPGQAMTGVIWRGSPPEQADNLTPMARWDEVIRLLSQDLLRTAAGDVSGVQLTWATDAQIEWNYTVFVHAYSADGQFIGQHDSPPIQGALPTTLWSAEARVVDLHPLVITPGSAPVASVCVGLYRLETLQRVAVVDGGGNQVKDDEVCFSEQP